MQYVIRRIVTVRRARQPSQVLMEASKPETEPSQLPGPLVVLLHGYTNRPEDMNSVESLVETVLPGARVFKPPIPLSRWSTADPAAITRRLLIEITERWEALGKPKIIFVGHSVGGLFARKVYVAACGPTKDAPFSDSLNITEPQSWAPQVQRIILLAGMNGGWHVSYHFSAKSAIIWTVGIWIGHFVEFLRRKPLIILQMRRGAPFLTQLRLQWLAMRKHAANRGAGGAVTVQLLGSIDDVVSPEDDIDLVSGRDFIYMDVPETGHSDIIDVDRDSIEHKESRSNILAEALRLPTDELKERAQATSDQTAPREDPAVTDVIFVVHGIRDVGYWTQKVARRIVKRAKDALDPHKEPVRVFATETASYGYFPMAPFLFAAKRREKVEWLMNQYAEAMANYPNAEFSCVAHSNGTYLIAKALETYAACRFKRIVFAGSVVRQNFDWKRYIESERVGAVLNYVATGDWVVAFFPKIFELIRIQDLGSAGFDGFIRPEPDSLWQVKYVTGDHGAALKEKHWDDIADFIIKPIRPPNKLPAPVPGGEGLPQCRWMKTVGLFPPIVWALLIGLVVFFGWVVSVVLPNDVLRTVGLLLYAKLIWDILTRV